MNAEAMLEEIREHAETMAKGTEHQRSRAYAAARRLLEEFDELNKTADWDHKLVGDHAAVLRDQLQSLSILNSSQAIELDQHWSSVQTSIDTVAAAMAKTRGTNR